MASIQWQSKTRSEIGRIRKTNEDAVHSAPELGLWIIADGMGGYEAGDLASQMVIDILSDAPNFETLEVFVDDVKNRLEYINREMILLASRIGVGKRMGSTVVVMLVRESKLAIIWAGDSRLYRLRDRCLQRLTKDHSELEKLIDLGVVEEENSINHPSSRYLTRAVGVHTILQLDVIFETFEKDDGYLLCTDGLNKEVNDRMIEKIMCAAKGKDSVCDYLIKTALDRGGRDNISIVTVHAK